MAQPLFQNRTSLCFLAAVCLLGSGLGFFISFQQDQQRTSEAGQLAWNHLRYALELNDDMAVIDWSKSLELMDTVLAFTASADSKPVADGGNRNFLPVVKKTGTSYRFPSTWFFSAANPTGPTNSKELTVAFKFFPGPVGWAILAGASSLLAGLGILFLGPLHLRKQLPSLAVATQIPSTRTNQPPTQKPNLRGKNLKKSYLFLDKNYVIQEITPEAAQLLQKKDIELLNGHLLDLEPDPTLMNTIEKLEEISLENVFPSRPQISVSLKPDSNGTWLFLDVAEPRDGSSNSSINSGGLKPGND